jgi:predicted Zn-dependent peptidase
LYTAILIGSYTVYFNDPNLINTTLAKENAVTLAQVNAATRRFLVRDQRTVVITLPAGEDASATPKAGK